MYLCKALEKWFTSDDVSNLIKYSRRLSRWCERECGDDRGGIERDEKTGKPYWISSMTGKRFPIRDMETATRKRVDNMVKAAGLTWYYQTDPRGCPLYIIREGDIPEGNPVDNYYTNGVAVCVD